MKTIRKISLKSEPSEFESIKITTSMQGYEYIKRFFFDDITLFESFYMLMFNRANKTIAYVKISQGGVSGTVVDPKIIAKYAVDSLCSSVIIAHNHPSGETRPSESDILITNKIKEGLKLFDINLLDHLIICEGGYHSFADNGMI